jgi:hypothetical protein
MLTQKWKTTSKKLLKLEDYLQKNSSRQISAGLRVIRSSGQICASLRVIRSSRKINASLRSSGQIDTR